MSGKPIVTEGQYDGKPSLTLLWRADGKYPFSFGVTKARLILACISEIQAFVDKHPDESTGARRGTAQRHAPSDGTRPDAQGSTPPAGPNWTDQPKAMLEAQGKTSPPQGTTTRPC